MKVDFKIIGKIMLNLVYCKAQVANCVNDVAKVSKKAADDKHCVMQSFGWGGGGVCLFPSAFFVARVLFNND